MVVLTKFRAQLPETVSTVMDRIAGSLKTLPKYLYFPNGVPTIEEFQAGGDFEVVDLLAEIKKPVTVKALTKNLTNKISQQGLTWGSDVFVPYIAFNETLKNSDSDMLGSRLMKYGSDIQKVVPDFDIQAAWNAHEAFADQLTDHIAVATKRSKEAAAVSKSFGKTKAGVPATSVVLEAVTLKFPLDLGVTFGSPLEVLNYIVTSKDIPYVTTNGVYKILKDLSIPRSWGVSSDESIDIKVQAGLEGAPVRYMDGIIFPNEAGTLTVEVELDVSKPTVSNSAIISSVVSIFPTLTNVTTGHLTESTVKGSFNFPRTSLSSYIFSDLVLNDPMFSQYLTIKENDKATKAQKTGLYISFDHPSTGHISAVLTEQFVTDQTPQAMRKDSARFPMGSTFVRIRISRADSREAAEEFQSILSKLMAQYNSKSPALIKVYKKFIPSFAVEKPPKPTKEKASTLQDIDGDVFVEYYSRWCREAKQPTIVSDAEAKAAEKRGLDVMVYPRPGTGTTRRNYICEKEGFPWPGVQKNNTSNAARFPYVPCCFATSQKNGKKYKEYFAGGEGGGDMGAGGEGDSTDDERDHAQILKDKKILKNNAYGEIQPNISKMFGIIDPEDGFSYLRHGMHRSKSSFLDCVLTASEINDIQHLTKVGDRLNEVHRTREQLATPLHAALCRQEMYDSTIEQIVEQIKDPEVYLDPRLYVSLLEVVYNCRIFIFSTRTPGGEMTLPRYKQAYYKTHRNVPSIAIYEHWGSEANQAKYPQCELIMKWNEVGTRDWEVRFRADDPISIGLEHVESKLRSAYALNTHIPYTMFPALDALRVLTPPKSPITIVGQGIDSYGKCRAVLIKYKKILVTLLTSPMPPFPVMDIGREAVRRVKIADALAVAKVIGLPVSAQVIQSGAVQEIRGKIGMDISVVIPISDSSAVGGIPKFDATPEYPTATTSALMAYNQSKQLARYLTEYTLWLYSRFIGDDDMTMESYAKFADQHMRVSAGYKYEGHMTGELSMSSPVMSDGKLVVRSKEVQKRLIFGLRLACNNEPVRVRKYKDGTNVPNFYMDLADFDQYPNQVVLTGSNSVEKWIADQQTQINLQSSIVVHAILTDSVSLTSYTDAFTDDASIIALGKEKKLSVEIIPGQAYFFKNSLVGADVYLAQNALSVREALGVFRTWQQDKYNPTLSKHAYAVPGFTLYSYVNSGDITPHHITGEYSQDSTMKIIGCVVGGVEHFTVLLPL